jgi:hypothetical protein
MHRAVKGLHFGSLSITYLPFDEPYVRAAGPRLVLALPQIAADFGAPLTRTGGYSVRIHSFPDSSPFQYTNIGEPIVPSPLSPGFSLGIVQSPEEYLFGYLADTVSHELLKDEFGERAQAPARLALAHAAVQWEVEQATGHDHTLRLAATVGQRTPLSTLLDPLRDPGSGVASNQGERDLFLRFAIATHGRAIIAPYLQAVFHSDSAEELVEAVFGQDLADIEQEWRAWLERFGVS